MATGIHIDEMWQSFEMPGGTDGAHTPLDMQIPSSLLHLTSHRRAGQQPTSRYT